MLYKAIIVAAALSLAACDDGKPGTDIAINAAGENGSIVAAMDGKTGQVAIDVPGFSGKIRLPKIKLDADNFDMNGVHLYPGSTIGGMNIDASDTPGVKEKGIVRVSFNSPADAATVRDWFLEKLSANAGFKIKAEGAGIVGTTDEGKAFRLDLAPDGANKAKGTIVLGG